MADSAARPAVSDLAPPPEGIVVVDKPSGWTSHDVVARIRRLAGTKRVGHAGTLDPMATGVLVVGVGRATRLLGYISGADKTYAATIRLGWATVTDDAEGQRLDGAPAHGLARDDLDRGIAALTGPIMQRPSAVSAIKVDGRRSHERVRSGEEVDLPERPVTVTRFDILDVRPDAESSRLDVDVVVDCTSGTYVRALARDLGSALGVGGHLTALRRTIVGCFDLAQARTLEELAETFEVTDMASAASAAFASVTLTAADANAVKFGRPVELGMAWVHSAPAVDVDDTTNASDTSAVSAAQVRSPDGATDTAAQPHALFAADGEFLALARPRPDNSTEYLAVFSQP